MKTMIKKEEVIKQISFLFSKAKDAEEFRSLIIDYQLGLQWSMKEQ